LEGKKKWTRIVKDDSNDTTNWQHGIDELNLAEFPLAAISDRIGDGIKTVTLEDSIFDRVERRQVTRRIILSGSDQYGLPTAKDDDVLLACIQISKQQDFRSPNTLFTRYELLKLLGWSDESKSYARLAQSLRRWKGLTIFSDRAFYDFSQKSWVNRDFGVFDSLYIYRKEADTGRGMRALSRFTWNEVLFSSFQSGYLKRIDWRLYTSLRSPIAKRLYRLLDKRFFRSHTVEFDLQDLATRKLRMSSSYNTAQIKRAIRNGIDELVQRWHLKSIPDSKRYAKQATGNWIVRFERVSHQKVVGSTAKPSLINSPSSAVEQQPAVNFPKLDQLNEVNLQVALSKRGIGPAVAEELSQNFSLESLQTMVELFDWYNGRNQPRGPGFLIQAIRNPKSIEMPRGFQSSTERNRTQASIKDRQRVELTARAKRESQNAEKENRRRAAFQAFWGGLSINRQNAFEGEALDLTSSTKRNGYYQHQPSGGKLFAHYRYAILIEHFDRNKDTIGNFDVQLPE